MGFGYFFVAFGQFSDGFGHFSMPFGHFLLGFGHLAKNSHLTLQYIIKLTENLSDYDILLN